MLVDNDYTGSIVALIENTGSTTLEVKRGVAYVQLIPIAYYSGDIYGAYLSNATRGGGGFGSTNAQVVPSRALEFPAGATTLDVLANVGSAAPAIPVAAPQQQRRQEEERRDEPASDQPGGNQPQQPADEATQ